MTNAVQGQKRWWKQISAPVLQRFVLVLMRLHAAAKGNTSLSIQRTAAVEWVLLLINEGTHNIYWNCKPLKTSISQIDTLPEEQKTKQIQNTWPHSCFPIYWKELKHNIHCIICLYWRYRGRNNNFFCWSLQCILI